MTTSNTTIGMTVEYFTVKAWHSKINNLKNMSLGSHLQQTIGGLHYPPQANEYPNINKRYGREVTAKNINKSAVTIPEEVFFLQQKPTGLQASSSNSQNLTWTPLHSSLEKTEPLFNLSSCF